MMTYSRVQFLLNIIENTIYLVATHSEENGKEV